MVFRLNTFQDQYLKKEDIENLQLYGFKFVWDKVSILIPHIYKV